jgi:hypothetical protein
MSEPVDREPGPPEAHQGHEPTAVDPDPQQAGTDAPSDPQEALTTAPEPEYSDLGISSQWDVTNELLVSLVRRVLDGLIGDAVRLVVLLDDPERGVRTFGDHPDTWGLLDALVCSEDDLDDDPLDHPGEGPGTRGKLLN